MALHVTQDVGEVEAASILAAARGRVAVQGEGLVDAVFDAYIDQLKAGQCCTGRALHLALGHVRYVLGVNEESSHAPLARWEEQHCGANRDAANALVAAAREARRASRMSPQPVLAVA